MPTLLQLQSEPYWNDEQVTDALEWLGDQLCSILGVPRVSYGVKGNELHLRGSHRSQRWLLNSRFSTSRSYTVQSGLAPEFVNLCAGVDFKPATQAQMNTQSRRIYDAMRAGQLPEVREFFGTFDGKTVIGWDNVNKRDIISDDSHTWHWHAGLDRAKVQDRAVMIRILNTVLGDTMTPAQEAKLLADVAMARSLLHEGKRGAGLPDTAGGGTPIAYLTKQFFDAQAKLDSLLGEVGQLTVDMANLKEEVAAIKSAVDNIPAPGETVLSFEPVTLSGELRFENPTS